MVLLTLTSIAGKALEIYDESKEDISRPPSEPGPHQDRHTITHGELIDISARLKRREPDGKHDSHAYDLDTLLRGARIYAAPPEPKPEKSPEYIQLMARLREEEAQRAYDRMTAPPQHPTPDSFIKHDSADEITYSDVNRQVTLIINVLVTIIACSAGIWVTAWHWSTPARLGLSMTGSVAVAVAEVAIYFGYIKRISDAKITERKRTESKEIVDTWVIDGNVKESNNSNLRSRKGKHR